MCHTSSGGVLACLGREALADLSVACRACLFDTKHGWRDNWIAEVSGGSFDGLLDVLVVIQPLCDNGRLCFAVCDLIGAAICDADSPDQKCSGTFSAWTEHSQDKPGNIPWSAMANRALAA